MTRDDPLAPRDSGPSEPSGEPEAWYGADAVHDPYNDAETHRLHGLDLAVQADAPVCRRCDGPGILETRVPHVWDNGYGEPLPCMRVLVLCPACDHAAPAAADLLALFTVDDRIGDANAEVFSDLVALWLAEATALPAHPATLEDADQ
ncbi:MAG TPA: DUF6300 family protein [Yinghuangia sp.]|uniref:DUF6300 family protein n=1 Tax=Yinghuangia sp. YIM S10712 TaxID=3436930 RepID=UPI002CDF61DD|nr:DUF6300 family protein [Yinghuangia sp.]